MARRIGVIAQMVEVYPVRIGPDTFYVFDFSKPLEVVQWEPCFSFQQWDGISVERVSPIELILQNKNDERFGDEPMPSAVGKRKTSDPV